MRTPAKSAGDARANYLVQALEIAAMAAYHTDDGENAESLETLAECAYMAAYRARKNGDITRLLHVAEFDVPRLLREIDRLARLHSSTVERAS